MEELLEAIMAEVGPDRQVDLAPMFERLKEDSAPSSPIPERCGQDYLSCTRLAISTSASGRTAAITPSSRFHSRAIPMI